MFLGKYRVSGLMVAGGLTLAAPQVAANMQSAKVDSSDDAFSESKTLRKVTEGIASTELSDTQLSGWGETAYGQDVVVQDWKQAYPQNKAQAQTSTLSQDSALSQAQALTYVQALNKDSTRTTTSALTQDSALMRASVQSPALPVTQTPSLALAQAPAKVQESLWAKDLSKDWSHPQLQMQASTQADLPDQAQLLSGPGSDLQAVTYVGHTSTYAVSNQALYPSQGNLSFTTPDISKAHNSNEHVAPKTAYEVAYSVGSGAGANTKDGAEAGDANTGKVAGADFGANVSAGADSKLDAYTEQTNPFPVNAPSPSGTVQVSEVNGLSGAKEAHKTPHEANVGNAAHASDSDSRVNPIDLNAPDTHAATSNTTALGAVVLTVPYDETHAQNETLSQGVTPNGEAFVTASTAASTGPVAPVASGIAPANMNDQSHGAVPTLGDITRHTPQSVVVGDLLDLDSYRWTEQDNADFANFAAVPGQTADISLGEASDSPGYAIESVQSEPLQTDSSQVDLLKPERLQTQHNPSDASPTEVTPALTEATLALAAPVTSEFESTDFATPDSGTTIFSRLDVAIHNFEAPNPNLVLPDADTFSLYHDITGQTSTPLISGSDPSAPQLTPAFPVNQAGINTTGGSNQAQPQEQPQQHHQLNHASDQNWSNVSFNAKTKVAPEFAGADLNLDYDKVSVTPTANLGSQINNKTNPTATTTHNHDNDIGIGNGLGSSAGNGLDLGSDSDSSYRASNTSQKHDSTDYGNMSHGSVAGESAAYASTNSETAYAQTNSDKTQLKLSNNSEQSDHTNDPLTPSQLLNSTHAQHTANADGTSTVAQQSVSPDEQKSHDLTQASDLSQGAQKGTSYSNSAYTHTAYPRTAYHTSEQSIDPTTSTIAGIAGIADYTSVSAQGSQVHQASPTADATYANQTTKSTQRNSWGQDNSSTQYPLGLSSRDTTDESSAQAIQVHDTNLDPAQTNRPDQAAKSAHTTLADRSLKFAQDQEDLAPAPIDGRFATQAQAVPTQTKHDQLINASITAPAPAKTNTLQASAANKAQIPGDRLEPVETAAAKEDVKLESSSKFDKVAVNASVNGDAGNGAYGANWGNGAANPNAHSSVEAKGTVAALNKSDTLQASTPDITQDLDIFSFQPNSKCDSLAECADLASTSPNNSAANKPLSHKQSAKADEQSSEHPELATAPSGKLSTLDKVSSHIALDQASNSKANVNLEAQTNLNAKRGVAANATSHLASNENSNVGSNPDSKLSLDSDSRKVDALTSVANTDVTSNLAPGLTSDSAFSTYANQDSNQDLGLKPNQDAALDSKLVSGYEISPEHELSSSSSLNRDLGIGKLVTPDVSSSSLAPTQLTAQQKAVVKRGQTDKRDVYGAVTANAGADISVAPGAGSDSARNLARDFDRDTDANHDSTVKPNDLSKGIPGRDDSNLSQALTAATGTVNAANHQALGVSQTNGKGHVYDSFDQQSPSLSHTNDYGNGFGYDSLSQTNQEPVSQTQSINAWMMERAQSSHDTNTQTYTQAYGQAYTPAHTQTAPQVHAPAHPQAQAEDGKNPYTLTDPTSTASTTLVTNSTQSQDTLADTPKYQAVDASSQSALSAPSTLVAEPVSKVTSTQNTNPQANLLSKSELMPELQSDSQPKSGDQVQSLSLPQSQAQSQLHSHPLSKTKTLAQTQGLNKDSSPYDVPTYTQTQTNTQTYTQAKFNVLSDSHTDCNVDPMSHNLSSNAYSDMNLTQTAEPSLNTLTPTFTPDQALSFASDFSADLNSNAAGIELANAGFNAGFNSDFTAHAAATTYSDMGIGTGMGKGFGIGSKSIKVPRGQTKVSGLSQEQAHPASDQTDHGVTAQTTARSIGLTTPNKRPEQSWTIPVNPQSLDLAQNHSQVIPQTQFEGALIMPQAELTGPVESAVSAKLDTTTNHATPANPGTTQNPSISSLGLTQAQAQSQAQLSHNLNQTHTMGTGEQGANTFNQAQPSHTTGESLVLLAQTQPSAPSSDKTVTQAQNQSGELLLAPSGAGAEGSITSTAGTHNRLDFAAKGQSVGADLAVNDEFTQNAVVALQQAAAQGVSQAQYLLGVAYEQGSGVPIDLDLAMKWYHQAALQGDTNAKLKLAQWYEQTDPQLSAKWLLSAAQQGVGLAQYQLGMLYLQQPQWLTFKLNETPADAASRGESAQSAVENAQLAKNTHATQIDASTTRPTTLTEACTTEPAADHTADSGKDTFAPTSLTFEASLSDLAPVDLHQTTPLTHTGNLFQLDQGLTASQALAHGAYWLTQAAKQGVAQAQFQLGLLYSQGKLLLDSTLHSPVLALESGAPGTPATKAEDNSQVNSKVNSDDTRVQQLLDTVEPLPRGLAQEQSLGKLVSQPEQTTQSIQSTLTASQPMAQSEEHFEQHTAEQPGEQFVRDSMVEAVKWFTLAAQQGVSEAQFNLGLTYAKGQGVPQDLAQALKYFTQSAQQGFVPAQFKVAQAYASGQGVDQDLTVAAYWYDQAAQHNHASAQYRLGLMYLQGQGVNAQAKLGFKYVKAAAANNLPEAQLALASLYERGYGVEAAPAAAAYWYAQAAAQGLVEAQVKLGNLYAQGRGVPQNYEHAIEWFTKAAEQEDMDAQFNLGAMYYQGQGVPKDIKTAVMWYSRAAQQGDAQAQALVGFEYLNGRNIPQDKRKAKLFLDQSCTGGVTDACKLLAKSKLN